MVVTSWPIARRLLSYSPIGHWSYEMIRSENGLSYVNKSQEPKARLRLICEVIAIFARTIRNSQRPSIIIIYRRSPNSYRAHTYVRRTEEERRRTRVWVDARTRTHAGSNPFCFITAFLSRGSEALLPDPALNYDWTRYIDPRRSWFEASRERARVHKRFASSHLRQSRWRYRLVSARGLSARAKWKDTRGDGTRRASIVRSIDRPGRYSIERAQRALLLHLWIRARNASRDAPRIH